MVIAVLWSLLIVVLVVALLLLLLLFSLVMTLCCPEHNLSSPDILAQKSQFFLGQAVGVQMKGVQADMKGLKAAYPGELLFLLLSVGCCRCCRCYFCCCAYLATSHLSLTHLSHRN